MALARVKTWVAGEVLTASDLNAEINNILNNATSLVSPLIANLDLGGFSLIALSRGSVTAPSLAFTGDTNTGLFSSGADAVGFTAGGATAFFVLARVAGTTYAEFKRDSAVGDRFYPVIAFGGSDDGMMSVTTGTIDLVAGGRRVLQASAYTNATNYLRMSPAQAGVGPLLDVAGADTNIDLRLAAKGSGIITAATAFRPGALTGSPPPRHALVQENVPSAWVTFRGKVGASIYASFGVTSVTRDAAGTYSIVWQRNFAQGSAYAVLVTAMQSTPGLMSAFVQAGSQVPQSVTIHTAANDSGTASDADQVHVFAIGTQENT